MRVVSLSPAITELLFALELDQDIVGVTQYCDFPPAVVQKQVMGKPLQPDLDVLEEVRPELVFTLGEEQKQIKQQVEALGFEVHHEDPQTLKEVFEMFIRVGEKVDRAGKARSLVNSKKAKLHNIETQTKDLPEKKVLIEVQLEQPTPEWIREYTRYVKANTFTTTQSKLSPQEVNDFQPDLLITFNPDLCEYECENLVKLDPLLARPGPRIPQAAELLGSLLHPDQFKPFGSMRKDIDQYYEDIDLPDPKAQYEM